MWSFRITSCRESRTFARWQGRFRRGFVNRNHPLKCSISKNIAVWVRRCATLWLFPGSETCLIEADRDREKTRLTYSDFKEISMPLARAGGCRVRRGRSRRDPDDELGRSGWGLCAYAALAAAACWLRWITS